MLQDLSYTLTIVFSLVLSQMTWNLLTAAMRHSGQSRGQTVFFYSTCGTLGVLIMDKIGGDLTQLNSAGPFLVNGVQFILLIIVLLVGGLCTKSLHH